MDRGSGSHLVVVVLDDVGGTAAGRVPAGLPAAAGGLAEAAVGPAAAAFLPLQSAGPCSVSRRAEKLKRVHRFCDGISRMDP